MNDHDNLILVKNKDKTIDIDLCKYENGKWMVRYQNNQKVYSYSYENVALYKNPNILDHHTCMVYENNVPISGVITIIDFGDYVKLFFKSGAKKLCLRSNIFIEETSLIHQSARNTFEYLKALAQNISVKDDDDFSFISKQYNSLTQVSPRSVLARYLEGKEPKTYDGQVKAIFPFGFNISQKSATEKALNNQVSIIEGPPGTGKTQTILNIIANAIINNKTVAVVSNNNSATANILEKLARYEVEFIAAYLGNKENKAKFFAQQNNTYPNMSKWDIQPEDYKTLRANLIVSQKQLNEMLTYRNRQAVLKQELSELQTEFAYFKKYYDVSNFDTLQLRSISNLKSDKILKILAEYTSHSNSGKVSLKDKLYYLFVYGIYDFKLYKYSPEQIITLLQKSFYEKKINELLDQIVEISNRLQNYNFDKEMEEYSQLSMNLLKAKLVKKYKGGSRGIFNESALWKNFDAFIKEYPVILSTTHSLRSCIGKNYLFDYLIVDEASQVDIVTGALALSCAKNAVIVGDTKQLPMVIPNDIGITARNIFDSSRLDVPFNYTQHSLLSSFLSLYNNIPKTLLKEHYRCHPKIIGFCNQKFYNNELIIFTDEKEDDKPLVLYRTTKGNHARGKVNQRQIDVIFNEIIPELEINTHKQTVGLISPYRPQANELNKAGEGLNIDADTVHKFQGRERDVIILSTVANKVGANDFVDNSNLINVAVSRAVDQLIVVVAEGLEEKQGTNISDLVRYIKYNNFEVIESQIYSVFDLLYSNFSDKLLELSKKHKKVSKYQSENLMNIVIKKVLSDPEFQNLDWVLHQPLRMLIKDPKKLTDDERKYAMNILTHTDFIIFKKIDKMPVLVVEVDGHAFHANNPTQLKRDKLKDEILRKYNIPFIRMKTTESREEERLRLKLVEVLELNSLSESSSF